MKKLVLLVIVTVTIFGRETESSTESGDAVSISIGPRDQKVLDNGVAAFFCRASGWPTPDVQWRRNGRRISSVRPRYQMVNSTRGSVLRIEPVRASDEGQIECRAETEDGKWTSSNASLLVYATIADAGNGFPHISEGPLLRAVQKGESVEMPCTASGNPQPNITWYKDFVPIFSSEARVTIQSTGLLRIEEVDESDEGKYDCSAENEVGATFSYYANLYVRVRRVAPHFSIPPENVEVTLGGSANLTCVAVGSPMPYVKWKLGSKEITAEEEIPIGKNVLLLTNIRQSSVYTCVASSDLGTIVANAEVKVKALPRAPTHLVASDVTSTSVRLRWSVANGADPPVDSHVILYRRRPGPSRKHPVEEVEHFGRNAEHVITSLSPHTVYEFHVVAVNNVGRSASSNTIEVLTLESKPGSPPQNVRARPISSSTVVVQWDEPKTPNGVIKGYKIFYTLTPHEPLSKWNVQTVDNSQLTTVSNLITNRTYAVTVLGFTGVGDGPTSEPVQVKTQQGVTDNLTPVELPSQPNNVRGEVLSSRTIQVTWDAPDPPGELLESYELFYNDSSFKQNVHVTISPPRTSFVMEDLTPNTIYLVKVAARSSRGEGASSPTISVTTFEDAPSVAPLMVQGEAIDSTSFRVTWSPIPRDQQNGVVIGYRILYAKVASNQGVDGPLVVKVTAPGTERSQVVKGAEKWTQYSVWVQGFTRKGDGPVSDVIVIQTAEDVPGEPRKVRAEAVNASAVMVHWRSPAENEQNGIIRGYQVIYSKVSDDDTPLGQTLVFDIMDGTAMESIVTGLDSNTEYHFQVAAYTRKGDGLRSRPKKVKTKGAVLGAPRNVRLVMVQEDPPVVEITWQAPPRIPLAAILGYRVQYGVRGSSSDEMEARPLDADKYKYTTGFLDRGVEYEFRVSSKNNVDYGEPAIERLETPEGIPAGAPLNASFGQLTSSSVQLVWDPPAAKHRNGQIVLYEIIYHERLNYVDDWMTNTTDTWMTIEGLDPGSGYLFQIRAYTRQGCGPWSGPVEVMTPKLDNTNFVPYPPSGIALRRVSPSILRVSWDPLLQSEGGVTGFQIFYSTYAMADLENWKTQEIEGMSSSSVEITGLQPHATYFVKIRTVLDDGRFSDFSKVAFERGTTIPESAIPDDMVKDFFAREYGPTFISLEWNPPRKTGIQYYKVNLRGTKFYRDESGVERVINSEDKKVASKDERRVTVDGLIPSTVYTFNISAYFTDNRWGTATNINVETDVDVPPPMQAPRIRGRTGRGISVRLFTASERNGKIIRYYLVVVQLDVSDKRSANSFTLPELSRQGTEESAVAWIAAAFTFLPKEFTIGGNSSTQRSSSTDAMARTMRSAAATGKYVNRPLTSGKAYRVFVRAYTSENKFTSSPYSETMEAGGSGRGGDDDVLPEPIGGGGTEPDESAGIEILWIVAPVCVAVVVVLLGVLVVVFIRRSCRREEPLKLRKVPLLAGEMVHRSHDPVELRRLNFLTPGMASHPPIALSQLSDVINRLKSNDREEFSREYESIEPGQQFTWEASSADVNKAKNRYANVIAYDHSRVTLRPIEGVPGSDYVNANFMDGYCRQNAYVATQGPLVETFGDFWRMIWEQRSTTIVMMTKLEERNRIKCDQYWPSRGTELYGTTQVSIVDVIEMATFTIRTFQISQVNFLERREVHQLQFTAWPDHGVPDHPTPLLNFIRKVKAVTPPDAGPMIVHCSAGVGRSGTFIVIDAMLDRIQREKMIDVYGHVTCLRSQRNYMVQTEDQYVFIYDAVLEAVESGNTEVPADSLYVHVQHLTHLEPGETITGMELEFKKLNNMKLNPMLFVSASLPINKYKNRLVNILPYESTRVCLQPIRGVEGSDYINANFIDGYRFRKTYIATQGPMADTTEDFWRMLWEHNCNIIVMLTKLKELGREKCSQYWPEERSARYRYFVVDPMAQYNMPLYVLREFKVTDARDGQSRIIRQFQFTDWPEQGVPASGEGFIEFIGHVQKTKEQFGQDGPIVVHCSMGVGRTGVFVVLSIVLERMRYEGVVDLFQTVKMLRTQRPAMVQSEEQYAFCYRAALEYLSSFDHYTN